MRLIPYDDTRKALVTGLKEHLGVPVIRTNQTAPAPPYPYVAYTITTLSSANNGTWQQHDDGKDRKLVRQIWSISTLSKDCVESFELAVKARDWLEHTGRIWLKDRGVIVQSTTDITNRDNFLTVEYESKSGFDVVLYLYDTVDNPIGEIGYIETAEIQRVEKEEN